MTMIFEIEHHLWLDAICQNQNLWKNLLAKKNLRRPKTMYGWVNDMNTLHQQPAPYRYMKFDCSSLQL